MVDEVVSKWYRQDKKKTCYHLPRILSSSEYELESETSTGSALPLYTSSPPSPPSPIDFPPSYNHNMSQINFHAIIRQQQEQLAVMQMQIQALLAERTGGGEAMPREVGREGGVEIAKPQIFDSTSSKVAGFITACKLYIRMRLREEPVEEQVQWILSYIQGGTADVWKENVMEELEVEEIEYESAEEFLTSLKKEFGGREEESVKAAELRKLEQGERIIEEFVQEFKRVARGSGYEGRPLVEEFKRRMNGVIRRKLIEAENQPGSIEQCFRRAMAFDRNWKESRREEERLRGRKEQGGEAPKQEQKQIVP